MTPTLFLGLFFAMIIVIALMLGVRIVPQGYKHVVQRLGKYYRTLEPGLNVIIPFVDSVAMRVTTKEIVLDIDSQEVISKDNAVLITNAVAFIQITHPDKAVYGIEDYELAITNLIQTTLRSILGEIPLDDALSSRDLIRTKLKEGVAANISDWGITLKNVEIQDINPSKSMQDAMERQAAAERERRATVTKAQGEKEAAVLEADGRKMAAERDADAAITLAKASAEAIGVVTSAVGNQQLPAMYLLGEKYIKAIDNISNSTNAKTVILPADIQQTIGGLLGKKPA
ncbi:MAG: SPFH domain-containing protein [Mariprofundales bacterium]